MKKQSIISTKRQSTLLSEYRAAGKLKKSLTWKEIKEIVRDDRAETYKNKFIDPQKGNQNNK